MDENNPGRKLMCIWVDETEEHMIRGIYNHFDLELKEASHDDITQHRKNQQVDVDANYPVLIQPVAGEQECPHCLCSPCVTSQRFTQVWWYTQPRMPSLSNSAKRRTVYKKFWVMLLHRGLRKDPRYLERKRLAHDSDPRRKNLVWHHNRRDIIPNCVIRKVRQWLPNPPDTPFMGHMWE